jgi:hypothetical protein
VSYFFTPSPRARADLRFNRSHRVLKSTSGASDSPFSEPSLRQSILSELRTHHSKVSRTKSSMLYSPSPILRCDKFYLASSTSPARSE